MARDCTNGENGCIIPIKDKYCQDENDSSRFNRPSLIPMANTTIEISTINFNQNNSSGNKY